MTPVRCLLLLGLGLIGLPATGQGCIQQAWEPDTTILVGFLERRMDPGRPNYESVEREDEAEIYLYVRIGQPYCVAEEHDRPKADLVQLVLDRAGYDVLSPLVGRRIRLRGLMFEAHTARGGATLVVLPEAFVPAFPLWVWFIPSGHTHPLRELYTLLHANAVSIPGPAVSRLAQAAGDCGVTVTIGVNERNTEASDSSLFDTVLFLGPDGAILGKHRKLIPTTGERLVWAQGDGSDLAVYDTPVGRLGGLICWENYMPLARYALSAWGEQIHVAPTWDRGEPWISSMRHVAKESRCVVVSACQALRKDDIPDHLAFKQTYLEDVDGWLNPGKSLIVDPDGKIVAGPLEEAEGILYADFTGSQLVGPRWQLDVAGHYARPDIFELLVHQTPRPLIQTVNEPENDPLPPL